MVDNLIVIMEAIAALGFLIAIVLTIQQMRRSSSEFQINVAMVTMAMFLGMAISLMDVFQWANIGASFLVGGIEEVFTPLFGIIWMIAAYMAIKRSKEIPVRAKK